MSTQPTSSSSKLKCVTTGEYRHEVKLLLQEMELSCQRSFYEEMELNSSFYLYQKTRDCRDVWKQQQQQQMMEKKGRKKSWTELLQQASKLNLYMTTTEKYNISKYIITTYLLGYLYPNSTGNAFFVPSFGKNSSSMASPIPPSHESHDWSFIKEQKKLKVWDNPTKKKKKKKKRRLEEEKEEEEYQQQQDGKEQNETKNLQIFSSKKHIIPPSFRLQTSLEEKLEHATDILHCSTSTNATEHISQSFQFFLKNGLAPYLSSSSFHAQEVELCHLISMMICPTPSTALCYLLLLLLLLLLQKKKKKQPRKKK